MSNPKLITIAGGGLAGLTLGIALRRQEIPVTLFEAGRYPRHRVCGEFISGRGLEVLERLGLREKILAAGGREAGTAAFFSPRGGQSPRRLPEPAVCCSRLILDALLAREFQSLGGELHENERWRGDWSEGIVRATGRRAQAKERGWRWFGLKVHARGVKLAADLEMHLMPNGYVGICQLSQQEVNICGLFRDREAIPDLRETWGEYLRGAPGSPLHERLAGAEFAPESFCSIAGISLEPHPAESLPECAIGDALSMIPPVTGNGMSIAFESAALAAAPLAEYSRHRISWSEARQTIAQDCDAALGRRLIWAAQLHRWLLEPLTIELILFLAGRSNWFWRTSFALTR